MIVLVILIVVTLAVCFVVAAIGLVELIRRLVGRGEAADVLDEPLRARIDGEVLPCGCPRDGRLTAGCMACGWISCVEHAAAAHLCEPPADPIRRWQDAPTPPADPVDEALDTNPRHVPVGEHFSAWEQECASPRLRRLAEKLGGER